MTVTIISHAAASGSARDTTTSHSESHAPRAYQRRDDHKPRTSGPEEDHYVLTLQTDSAHQATMSEWRKRYFPAKMLKVDAHISLFRALPDSILSTIKSDIASAASGTTPFAISASKPFRMGRGVGLSVTGLEPADELFRQLQTKWYDVLSQQDRGKFRGHYTLMNLVNDEEAVKRCLEDVRREFGGCDGEVTGLSLWRYDRGWWRHDQDFAFPRTS
ncbi:Uu.00g021930.m01.CDS01 [Anthostomella pinea]|uniref:Uu.00g021930.m01.CDS01 n=1 Tax=Anthostomella pinea TaxID=933095 RepID=A0AAI8YQU1_9PEZI|nr:Uu.00g021930.m01.CDS01 [Anthostomella pinea]